MRVVDGCRCAPTFPDRQHRTMRHPLNFVWQDLRAFTRLTWLVSRWRRCNPGSQGVQTLPPGPELDSEEPGDAPPGEFEGRALATIDFGRAGHAGLQEVAGIIQICVNEETP